MISLIVIISLSLIQIKTIYFSKNTYSNKILTPDQELLNFIKNKNTDLKMLFIFPKVLSKFIQFNTSLSSKTPVEKLFSTNGNVMPLKRHRLSEEIFENLVLLTQIKEKIVSIS